ncbi:MAG: LytR/AlgR family response regulator transcription factor [Clostridia bacterium]
MIKVVIVDDEKPARDELRFLLESTTGVEVVGEAANGDEALQVIAQTGPDAVFLDVEMPGKSGLEIAEDLKRQPGRQPNRPKVVFATAYDEYAVRAFEVSAADYVLKPFEPHRVRASVEKLAEALKDQGVDYQGLDRLTDRLVREILKRFQPAKLPAERNGSTVLIDSSELMYVCSCNGKVILKTFDKEYVTRLTLEDIERRLGPRFLRVHRRFIVNLDRIAEVIPWFSGTYVVAVKDKAGNKVPVSRSQVKELKRALDL